MTAKPTERDLIEEAEELLAKYPQERVFAPTSKDLDAIPELLRRLVAEVKRLREEVPPLRERERKQLGTVIEIRGCDKCDLCEDHQ